MTASMRQRTDIGITTGWKRRSPGLERGLTVIAACFIPLAITVATGVRGDNKQSQDGVCNVYEDGGNENTCFTAACNDTATMILNNMDCTVDPCENFYMYACGGYLKSTKIPNGGNFIDSYSSTKGKVYEQLRAIVEAEIEPNEPKAYKLVKKFYRSCMNESSLCKNQAHKILDCAIMATSLTAQMLPFLSVFAAIVARGMQPLLADLRRIGGWPMIEGASWNESNFDWTKAIYELRKSGHSSQHIINFHVDVNRLNRTEHAIYISPPKWFLRKNGSIEAVMNVIVYQYMTIIQWVAKALGAQNDIVTEEEFEEITNFEINLEMIPIEETTINNTAATPMTLTELERNYPSIPWQEYICAMLSSVVSVPINQVMIVEIPIYFTRLDKLLSNTSKKVMANYIAYKTAWNSIQYVRKEQQSLAAPEENARASIIRKLCFKSISSLPFVLESMYVSRHFSTDAKNDVISIMDDVRMAIRKMLEETNWSDQIAKSQALRKLDTLRGSITHADQLSDDKLDKIYEKLEIDEDKYYENVHNISLFNTEYSLGKLWQPVDEGALSDGFKITDVDGAYYQSTNRFILAVGMLQDNFFGKDRPRYMNYGAIGTIIGHQIIRSLKNEDKEVNGEGKIVDWWQPSSETEFAKRAQCIVDQYNNYIVPIIGHKVDGALTLDEHIANNGGTKGAYLAYTNWVAKNRQEQKLPGIDMTPNQLFWMSKANSACSKSTPHHLIATINANEQSPSEFAIIGSMQNIPQFAKDFACTPGSKMNPTKKCSIW